MFLPSEPLMTTCDNNHSVATRNAGENCPRRKNRVGVYGAFKLREPCDTAARRKGKNGMTASWRSSDACFFPT
jgi:hypothetical protein